MTISNHVDHRKLPVPICKHTLIGAPVRPHTL
ncbi:hypothetical protein PITC_084020 [Penicillium italicum]|uniref:Uncharacterized protein n=1 Tax=Penicillium italicum TaxID=40296 RepID=A0A0A2L6G4_PENIT|nr:hypothetical protein PITC_084020 [Penicillium italicum]